MSAELDVLKAENERLKASQQESVVGELRARLTKLEADKAQADGLLKAADEAMKTATAKSAESDKTAEALKAKLEQASKDLEETKKEIGILYAQKKEQTRLATAKDKLKMADDAALEFVENTSGMSDEQFTKQIELLAKAYLTNNPQDGNTTFPAGKPKAPPKSTDKPTAPKATDKPAPLAGKASEEDAAGEDAADATSLENAEANAEASLSVESPDAGVSALAQDIARYLGVEEESK